jgi:stage II sporulation protein D
MRTDTIKIITIFIFLRMLSLHDQAVSQDIRIGLFEDKLVNTFVFHCIEGQYDLTSQEKSIVRVQAGELIYLSLIDSMLMVHNGNQGYGSFSSVRFTDFYNKGEFRIKIIDPAGDSRNYQGNLDTKVQNSVIQLINELPIENYLAGVVETEGGPSAPEEYYKAQAVICRTFSLKHWNRHESQGFNLCDDTHCQAYKGINDDNKLIFETVLVTHNIVLTDMKYALINPSFHANSGGETQRASDIWGVGEDYLQAVVDTFSERQNNSKWTKSISLSDWRKYLFSRLTGDTSKILNESLMIKQNHRKKYFTLGKDTLLISDIRNDMGFRSSFFSMELKADSVAVYGRGYGHGVGMSQEGAMEMARQKYSYSDILKFYYDMINISDISDLPDSELPEVFRKK